MMTIGKILCPVDFSKSSDHALEYAKAFAAAHGAELHLLHVVQPLTYGVGVDGIDVGVGPDVLDQMEEGAKGRLASVAVDVRSTGAKVWEHIVTGTPFIEIVRMARELKIDLIVIGTHGRSGLAHVLIGSVAERVVRKAPCPVLTVKHPEHDFVMP